jgi:predicted esterase
MQPLGLEQPFDGFLYVPPGYDSRRPAPLALTLHGSGGGANKGIGPLLEFADEAGSILVSPKSRGQTWDAVMGGFGPDVEFIDRALRKVFSSFAVDPGRLAIQGFSDGASYALALGLTNGDLFTHIIALSPGFTSEEEPRGDPKIFIAHGTDDGVLPIDQTSRQIVPRLEGAGYDVTFVEFDGGHVRKPEIVRGAVAWWLGEGRD